MNINLLPQHSFFRALVARGRIWRFGTGLILTLCVGIPVASAQVSLIPIYMGDGLMIFVPLDKKSPVIKLKGVVNYNTSGVYLRWETDKPTTSQILYGTVYNESAPFADEPTTQAITLDTNLMLNHTQFVTVPPLSLIYYQVISRDSSGNTTTSKVAAFQTNDLVPHIISSTHSRWNIITVDDPIGLTLALKVENWGNGSTGAISKVELYVNGILRRTEIPNNNNSRIRNIFLPYGVGAQLIPNHKYQLESKVYFKDSRVEVIETTIYTRTQEFIDWYEDSVLSSSATHANKAASTPINDRYSFEPNPSIPNRITVFGTGVSTQGSTINDFFDVAEIQISLATGLPNAQVTDLSDWVDEQRLVNPNVNFDYVCHSLASAECLFHRGIGGTTGRDTMLIVSPPLFVEPGEWMDIRYDHAPIKVVAGIDDPFIDEDALNGASIDLGIDITLYALPVINPADFFEPHYEVPVLMEAVQDDNIWNDTITAGDLSDNVFP